MTQDNWQDCTLEHELKKTRQALHLMTEAFELLEAERNALREEVDRLALDLHLRNQQSTN